MIKLPQNQKDDSLKISTKLKNNNFKQPTKKRKLRCQKSEIKGRHYL